MKKIVLCNWRWNMAAGCVQLARSKTIVFKFLGLLGVFAAPALHAAQEPVTLLFNERPPYLMTNANGSASGLTGTPAAKAFQMAGIPVAWALLSTKRQTQTLTENIGMSCAIGWFYKQEREQFAKFTKPIYRDRPFVAITARNFTPQEGQTLAQLLAEKKTSILLKEGFSYGDIDLLIGKYKPITVSSNGEVVEMMQMIKARRADLMFAAKEEADYLLQQAGFNPSDFRIIHFPDMPAGKTRHIMCSKNVPDALIQRLNAVLPAL